MPTLPPKKVTEHDPIATPLAANDLGFRTPNGVDEEVYSELDLWTQYLLQDVSNNQKTVQRRWVTNPPVATYYANFDGMNIQPNLPATASVASYGPTADHPTCTELATGTVAGQQYVSWQTTDTSRWARPGIIRGLFSLDSVSDVRFQQLQI